MESLERDLYSLVESLERDLYSLVESLERDLPLEREGFLQSQTIASLKALQLFFSKHSTTKYSDQPVRAVNFMLFDNV